MNNFLNDRSCALQAVHFRPGITALLVVVALSAIARAEFIQVQPDPLVLLPRHSADTAGEPFAFEPGEFNRVADLWRAGNYGLDPNAVDGYQPGAGPTNGLRHSADYSGSSWSIGYEEMLRFSGLHRAQSYRYDPNTVDGFTPVVDARVYQAPAAGSTAGTTRYVAAQSTNPVPPFTTLQTAAVTIQDAVALAEPGDLILVDRGMYASGMVSNQYGLSRVALTAGVVLASMHGPDETMIEGSTNAWIRGVFIQHPQAVFQGFTIRRAASRGASPSLSERDGGGLLVLAADRVADNVIHGCSALPFGNGGGALISGMNGVVEYNHVRDNRAYAGGGLAVFSGGGTMLRHAVLAGNHASMFGGGMLIDNARAYNLIVQGNHADDHGGGVVLGNNCELWFSTVVENSSENSGAGISYNGQLNSVRNSIITDNQGKDIRAAFSNNSLRFSFAATYPATAITVVSNVQDAPVFANAAGGNYRKHPSSPTINQGEWASWMTTFTDADGAPRIAGPRPDLGAFEWESPSLQATPAFYIPGEDVEITVAIDFPATRRLLAYGISVIPPAGWMLVDLQANPALEFSPDGQGYVTMGNLSNTAEVVVTLRAPSNAVGSAALTVVAGWMASGMEDVAFTPLSPDPFLIEPLYPVQASAGAGGNLTTTGGWFAAGATVEITAVADPGWRFGQWSGDLAGADIIGNTIILPVSGGVSVVAEFVRVHTVTIQSLYGNAYPGIGNLVIDDSVTITSRVEQGSVWIGTNQYVCVGWTGTGSAPASGSARETSFMITGDSTITWQWSRLQARQASRGYRAAGRMSSVIECDVWYEPSGTLTQIWWRALLPPGWSIHRAWGDAEPSVQGDTIFIGGDLSSGHTRFYFDLTLPDDAQGELELGGEVGVNQP